ncbi:MAG: hypothetical protein ABJ269_02710 [Parasphingorhabdus sp.]|uniref:hypothetical protein n=1 Tax=Parasphingorhabdus sp. TaxID=2709688 RepID=UPI003296BF5E
MNMDIDRANFVYINWHSWAPTAGSIRNTKQRANSPAPLEGWQIHSLHIKGSP